MNKKLPAWIVLTVIALVAALALAFTYDGTKDRIAAQEAAKTLAVRQELLPEAQQFNEDGENAVYVGVDAAGKAVGYVYTNTVQGFGGPVEITVATDPEGVIKGVRVGGSGFQETAGLGAKAKEPAFYEQFTGKTVPADLTKNGGEIDAITAATITSSAVVRGVNDSVKTIAKVAGFTIAEPAASVEDLGGGRYAVSKQGFGGPVYVELTLDDAGTITAIVIGDDRFSETSGFGAKAKEESFWGQYIGKGGTNLVLGNDVDAISGATITSNAVNDAVNMILLYVNDPAAFAAQQAAQAALDSVDVSIPEGAEVLTGEGSGLTGKFTVDVSVDENGVINGIRVNGTDSDMDASFLAKCQENNAFLAQFIGKTAPIDESAIDVVAGATVSSKGIVAAVNAAFAPADENAPAEDTVDVSIPEGAEVLTGEGSGLTGKFTVDVSVDENGAVNGIRVNDTESTNDVAFLAKCQENNAFLAQFIGKTAPIDESAIDVVAGATVSSKGIVAAVNAACEAAAASAAPEETAAPEAEGTTYTGEGSGVMGKFTVEVTVDDQGVITAVKVGDSDSANDAAFLAKCQDNEQFLAQFIGKTAPIDESAIDVVAGATVSSKGIVAAVNAACETAAASTAPEETAAPAPEGTTYTGEGSGVMGKFTVEVTVDDQGAITAVKVGDSDSANDAPFLAKCQDNEQFLAQFIGKTAPIDESAIDVVAGATVSSKGIVAAVNAACETAAPEAEGGTYTGKGNGQMGTFPVEVTVDAQGVITAVKVGDSTSDVDATYLVKCQENEQFLAQFIGKTAPIDESTIDVVSGATVSSKGIVAAINAACEAAK